MGLLLTGVLLLAFGGVIKLIPTRYNRKDSRVVDYNKRLDPLMTAMMVGGLLLIIAGVVALTL